MKQRIILHKTSVPLLWLALFLLAHFIPDFPFSKWVSLGLLIGTIIRLTFDSSNYLTYIDTNGEQLTLQWYTTFFKKKTSTYNRDEINELNFRKRNLLLRDFNQLVLRGDFQEQKFSIVDKNTSKKVKEIAANPTQG